MMKSIQKYGKVIVIAIIAFIAIMMIVRGGSRVVSRIGKGVKSSQKEARPVERSTASGNLSERRLLPVSITELDDAIRLAAGYLVSACDDNGRFNYRINLDPSIAVKPKYNMLRHAGTIYSLVMYEEIFPDEKTRSTIARSVGFLKKKSLAPVADAGDMLAVWSYPEVSGSDSPVQAKLGGTGLGLVALLSTEKVMPGTTDIDTLRKMGNFILYMQKDDGSFYSKYIPSEGGRNDEWVSLYYPGEAALGLLMLYEKDHSLKWLDGAAKALTYLARVRYGRPVVEADHWALLATVRLLPYYSRSSSPVPLEMIMQHAIQVSRSMYSDRDKYEAGMGLTGDGRTTPTATRLEGLQAALIFLPERLKIYDEIRAVVTDGMRFLVDSQLSSGEYAGAIPRAVGLLPSGHPAYSESFNRRATEVRIDYVQHALSAMIQQRKSLAGRTDEQQ